MIDYLMYAIDFAVNIDMLLTEIVTNYQYLTYLILFAIIFCETGLVFMPFLPGDTLLFATGTIAALDGNPLNIFTVIALLLTASFLGDNANFFVGRLLGHKLYKSNNRFIKKEYVDRTHVFFERYGGITLVFARFMPVVRTFAPFVAGIGEMNYHRFLAFSIVGNISWVVFFTTLGYFFGNIPIFKENFILVIGLISLVSILPAIITLMKQLMKKQKQKQLTGIKYK